MLTLTLAVYGYLVIINLVSFYAFALDKHRARTRRPRVAEAHLLLLAAIGGWLGAKLGQIAHARAIRSEAFSGLLNTVPAGQAMLVLLGALAMTALAS